MELTKSVTLSNEDVNKRKGKRISITIHAILLLLAIIPFLPIKETVAPAITIVFTDFKSGGSTEGASGGQKAKAMNTPDNIEAAPSETYTKPTPVPPTPQQPQQQSTPTPTPPEIVEVEEQEVEPEPTPQEEILVEDNSNPPLPPVEETEEAPDEVELPPYEIVPEESSDAPQEEVEEVEEAEEAPESFFPESSSADGNGTSSSDASTENGDDSFFSDGDGDEATDPGSGMGDSEPGTGTGDSGNGNDGQGNSGSGNGQGDGDGDGVLGRKVIYRANITEVANGKEGRIVIDLCINRNGIVTYAEVDKVNSSIKDTKVQNNALDAILNYRFEKDMRAPNRECGKYTLKFSRHGFEFR
ncbi:MAG: hypothetical protein AAGK97_08305 [Bacteroidota bacterium]